MRHQKEDTMDNQTEYVASNSIEQINELSKLTREDFSFFSNFDVITVRIIQKFYGTAIAPVNGDVNCFHVQQLHSALKSEGLQIGLEGLRKKLEFLVRIGFIEKVNTYPRVYMSLKHVDAIEKIQGKVAQLKRIFL